MNVTDPPAVPLGFDDLPEPLRARIAAELAPGERLLWAGRPDPARLAAREPGRATSWAWTIGWTVLALICLPLGFAPALRVDPRLDALAVVGVIVGATAAVVAFFFWLYQITTMMDAGPERRRIVGECYALTDRRGLIWKPVTGSAATSLIQITPRAVRAAHIERIEYPDGSGDLRFSPYHSADGVFRAVPRVREVDILARRVLVDPQAPLPSPDPDAFEEPF